MATDTQVTGVALDTSPPRIEEGPLSAIRRAIAALSEDDGHNIPFIMEKR